MIIGRTNADYQAFLICKRTSFSYPEKLVFIAVGDQPSYLYLRSQVLNHESAKVIMIFENDLLGSLTAILMACWLKNRCVSFSFQAPDQILIQFNGKQFLFYEANISLNRFEKASGFRSQVKTYKPKGSISFSAQLPPRSPGIP